MDAIKAEIERKRRLQQDAKETLGRKWVKRGEVEQIRQKQYYEEEARQAEERSKKAVAPQFRRAPDDGSASAAGVSSGADGAPTLGSSGGEHGGGASAATASGGAKAAAGGKTADKENMKPTEVKRKLRLLGQPIQLFGEDDEERLERYHAVSAVLPSESEVDDQLKKGQTWGQNESLTLARADGRDGEAGGGAAAEEDEEGDDVLAPSFVATTPEQTVARHFKQLLKLWEAELSQRPEEEAASLSGRQMTAAHQQAKRHMRPFFRQLRTREMPFDVLGAMVEITSYMQVREYVKAHDAYIRCAIGNAPWPMGITGTGIHERQGRQHLRESKVAHVMNDETQRKYLQSVKRLLTFAQKAMPPTGPSKTVN